MAAVYSINMLIVENSLQTLEAVIHSSPSPHTPFGATVL